MAAAGVVVEAAVRRYAAGKPVELLPALLSLLSRQQQPSSSALAAQLHADVAKRPPSAAASNSLLCYYLRSSRPDLALAHLRCRSTSPRDSLTYNILLNHLPAAAASSTIFRLFQLAMRDASFRPNVAALLTLLRASSSDHVEMMHAYLLKTAACIHTPVANSLISVYSTLGNFDSAGTVFDEMPARDVASWTSMIGACLEAGYAADALHLFGEMVSDGELQVDGVVAVVVLRACAMLEDARVGASVHAVVVCLGLQGDIFVDNSLVDMYAKCVDLRSAKKVFGLIAVKNVVSWNTMLSGLVHAGSCCPEEALHLLASWSLEIGVVGDETTLVVLLQLCKKLGGQAMWCRSVHGAAIRRRLLLSMPLLNALLDAYGKCGRVEDVLALFQGMRERNVITWSTVIGACSHNGQAHAAVACFAAMLETGERPNSVTVLSLVEACALCAEVRASRRAHGVAVRSGLASDELAVGNALVHMYGKCGDLGASARVFDTMPAKDVLTWNSMIGALGMNGRARDALALLRRMELELEGGVRPNGVTMLAALSACAHGGLVEEGIALLQGMERPRVEHLSCVVDMLARAGDLDGAAEIARRSSSPAAWSALLSACRRRGDGGGPRAGAGAGQLGGVSAVHGIGFRPGVGGVRCGRLRGWSWRAPTAWCTPAPKDGLSAMMHRHAARPLRGPTFASSSSALLRTLSSPSTNTNLPKLLTNRRRIIPVTTNAPHALANDDAHNASHAISFADATPTQPPIDLHPGGVRNELILLALPAVLGQAIDPLAQLMETAYIGRLGALELASAGIGVSVFNIVSKIFNIPLLSIATSFVAEDISKNAGKHSSSGKLELSSVSSALILAAGIGTIEALALFLGSGLFLKLMGVSPASPMHKPAQLFLSLRALGAPANVLMLAVQGIFRLGNLSAVVLLPLLICVFRLGITGAAISTVASQYIITILLLRSLSKRAVLLPPRVDQWHAFRKNPLDFINYDNRDINGCSTRPNSYGSSSNLLTSMACDALAVSAQAMIASSYAILDNKRVQKIAMFALQIGVVCGLALAAGLYTSFSNIARLFTSDPEVLMVVKSCSLFVCASQPINALAFIFDGLHYGVSDFDYVAQATIVVGIMSSLVLLYAPSVFGLAGVWAGLTTLMALRMAAGILRLVS
uniref:Protein DETOXIFICATION n=1 Tax=Leersia perrieri TaxID=77586 RepID=A0A0D9VN50_9ORYZ